VISAKVSSILATIYYSLPPTATNIPPYSNFSMPSGRDKY
jgi:hypothetical protein